MLIWSLMITDKHVFSFRQQPLMPASSSNGILSSPDVVSMNNRSVCIIYCFLYKSCNSSCCNSMSSVNYLTVYVHKIGLRIDRDGAGQMLVCLWINKISLPFSDKPTFKVLTNEFLKVYFLKHGLPFLLYFSVEWTINKNSHPWHCADLHIFTVYAVT